ncbi:MAG: hypothetical protein AAGA48_24705 [Myxococcota bacterium]
MTPLVEVWSRTDADLARCRQALREEPDPERAAQTLLRSRGRWPRPPGVTPQDPIALIEAEWIDSEPYWRSRTLVAATMLPKGNGVYLPAAERWPFWRGPPESITVVRKAPLGWFGLGVRLPLRFAWDAEPLGIDPEHDRFMAAWDARFYLGHLRDSGVPWRVRFLDGPLVELLPRTPDAELDAWVGQSGSELGKLAHLVRQRYRHRHGPAALPPVADLAHRALCEAGPLREIDLRFADAVRPSSLDVEAATMRGFAHESHANVVLADRVLLEVGLDPAGDARLKRLRPEEARRAPNSLLHRPGDRRPRMPLSAADRIWEAFHEPLGTEAQVYEVTDTPDIGIHRTTIVGMDAAHAVAFHVTECIST